MKANILMSLVLAGSLTSVAQAQEADQSSNTSTIKASDVQKKDETTKDIDDEITNAKMRAESGSKSKWSMSFDLGYSGGNVERPFAAERPNYAGEAATPSATNISGDIGASYRINKNNRLSLSTGITVLTPFQATSESLTTSTENGGNTEISTPSLTWGHSGKIGETQNSLSVSYSHYTDNYSMNELKQIGSTSLSHVAIFNTGTAWQPGISTSLAYYFYKDGKQDFDIIGDSSRRPDYQIGLYPFVEYEFNDRYSFRTVFRPFTYSHFRSDKADKFQRSLYTQSVGLGIAVARDVYLYPNFQFAPENLKPSLTNVGLNTTINLF